MKGEVTPRRPAKFDLSYRVYDVHFVDTMGMGGDNGHHDGDLSQIVIQESLSSREQANVFLHEFTHAVFTMWGVKFKDEDTEEVAVNAVANGICELLRRNPGVIDWVRSCISDNSVKTRTK